MTSDLLSGKDIPLSLQLKNLNGEWRRITVNTGGTSSGNIAVNVNGSSEGPASQNNLVGAVGSSRAYVTKGETRFIQGHAYVLAYHLPCLGLDLGKLLQAVATKTPPAAAVLTLETSIPLCLLQFNSLGSLEDVRPFDAKAEIAESESALRTLAALLKSQGGSGTSDKTHSPEPERTPEK